MQHGYLWFSSAAILGIFGFSPKTEVDSCGPESSTTSENPAPLIRLGCTHWLVNRMCLDQLKVPISLCFPSLVSVFSKSELVPHIDSEGAALSTPEKSGAFSQMAE